MGCRTSVPNLFRSCSHSRLSITRLFKHDMIYSATSVFPWTFLKCAFMQRATLQLLVARHLTSTYTTAPRMDPILYVSDIDAEPLHRYQKGGYHPITLGDTLKDGRYKVLHKLGWGGYSTVWAARDQRSELSHCFTPG